MYIGNGLIVGAANPGAGVRVAGCTPCPTSARFDPAERTDSGFLVTHSPPYDRSSGWLLGALLRGRRVACSPTCWSVRNCMSPRRRDGQARPDRAAAHTLQEPEQAVATRDADAEVALASAVTTDSRRCSAPWSPTPRPCESRTSALRYVDQVGAVDGEGSWRRP